MALADEEKPACRNFVYRSLTQIKPAREPGDLRRAVLGRTRATRFGLIQVNPLP